MSHTTGRITVAESAGQRPVIYLIGPSAPPFADLRGNGPVLATMCQTNPNAKADARLWARAGRLRDSLAELVDCRTRGNPLGECSATVRAIALLEELEE